VVRSSASGDAAVATRVHGTGDTPQWPERHAKEGEASAKGRRPLDRVSPCASTTTYSIHWRGRS
jgi:hypothetical protein